MPGSRFKGHKALQDVLEKLLAARGSNDGEKLKAARAEPLN